MEVGNRRHGGIKRRPLRQEKEAMELGKERHEVRKRRTLR